MVKAMSIEHRLADGNRCSLVRHKSIVRKLLHPSNTLAEIFAASFQVPFFHSIHSYKPEELSVDSSRSTLIMIGVMTVQAGRRTGCGMAVLVVRTAPRHPFSESEELITLCIPPHNGSSLAIHSEGTGSITRLF